MDTPITDTTRGKCIFCFIIRSIGKSELLVSCQFFTYGLYSINIFVKHFKDSYKVISRSMPRLPLQAQSDGQNHSCFLVPFIEPRGENPLVFSFSDSHRFCYSFHFDTLLSYSSISNLFFRFVLISFSLFLFFLSFSN